MFPNFLLFQALLQIICYGRDFVSRVIATPTYMWACFIIIVAGMEVLELAHGFAVDWDARCVPISTVLMLLIFSSTSARFRYFSEELRNAIFRADVPLIKYMAARLLLLGGEIVLVRFAVHMLERMVCFSFFCSPWSVG